MRVVNAHKKTQLWHLLSHKDLPHAVAGGNLDDFLSSLLVEVAAVASEDERAASDVLLGDGVEQSLRAMKDKRCRWVCMRNGIHFSKQ